MFKLFKFEFCCIKSQHYSTHRQSISLPFIMTDIIWTRSLNRHERTAFLSSSIMIPKTSFHINSQLLITVYSFKGKFGFSNVVKDTLWIVFETFVWYHPRMTFYLAQFKSGLFRQCRRIWCSCSWGNCLPVGQCCVPLPLSCPLFSPFSSCLRQPLNRHYWHAGNFRICYFC